MLIMAYIVAVLIEAGVLLAIACAMQRDVERIEPARAQLGGEWRDL